MPSILTITQSHVFDPLDSFQKGRWAFQLAYGNPATQNPAETSPFEFTVDQDAVFIIASTSTG